MKFGSFSIKSTFFNNWWKVDIYSKWIFSRSGYLMTFSDLKNGYSRYFQKVDIYIKLVEIKNLLRVDICRKWIIFKSGYFVTAQLEYVFNNWIKLICQMTYKSLIPIISNDFNPLNFLLANENRVFLRESFLILYIGCFTGRGEVIKHKYGHI